MSLSLPPSPPSSPSSFEELDSGFCIIDGTSSPPLHSPPGSPLPKRSDASLEEARWQVVIASLQKKLEELEGEGVAFREIKAVFSKKESNPYFSALSILRGAVQKEDLEARDFSSYLFTGFHLGSFSRKFMASLIHEGNNGTSSLNSSLTELPLEEQFNALNVMSPKWGMRRAWTVTHSLMSKCSFLFDPHWRGNLPYALYDFEILGKTTRCLRLATPTQDGYGPASGPGIAQEFRLHLEHLKKTGKLHAYFSLQMAKEGDEGLRTQQLKELAAEFSDNFRFFVFDQDSPWYLQTQQADCDLDSFKALFLDNFFGDKYEIPGDRTLREAEFLEAFKSACFLLCPEENAPLTQVMRQNLIEVTHQFFKIAVVRDDHPDYINNTCKDGIDRAGKDNSLFLMLIAGMCGLWFHSDTSKNDETRAWHSAYTHLASWLAKEQPIIEARAARLTQAYRVLDNVTVMARVLQLAEQYGVAGLKFPEEKEVNE